MQNLEEQIEATWQAVDRQREQVVADGTRCVSAAIDEELQRLLEAVRAACADGEPALQKDVQGLMQMAEQYRDGVRLWHQKAETSIRDIGQRQQQLAALVQEVSDRTETRREFLLQQQEQRLAQANAQCAEILRTTTS